MAHNLGKYDPKSARDEFVSFLPLAWMGEQMMAVASALLKPGGYSRLTQLAEISEGLEDTFTRDTVDLEKLSTLAGQALTGPRYAKEGKSYRPMKIDRSLVERVLQNCRLANPSARVIRCERPSPVAASIPECPANTTLAPVQQSP